MMCGGFGQVKPADNEVSQHLSEIKPHVESKMNATFTVFEPVHYKTQVVAGLNYLVKVKVDGEKYVHVKFCKPLPCNGTQLVLLSVEGDQSLSSDL